MKIYLDNAVRDNKITSLVKGVEVSNEWFDNSIENGMQLSKDDQQKILGLFYNDIMVIFKEYGITDDTYQIRVFTGLVNGMPQYNLVGIKTCLHNFYNDLYSRITRKHDINLIKSRCYDLQYEAVRCIGKHESLV